MCSLISKSLRVCSGKRLAKCYLSNTSKTEEFRSIPVEYKLLKYIKSVGVGIPERTSRKQRSRRKNLKFLEDQDEDQFLDRLKRQNQSPTTNRTKKPPPPFNGGFSSSRLIHDDERGWSVRTKPVKIVAKVKAIEDENFPVNDGTVPEVALAGRSNVGKSTLLNALLYDERKSSSGRKRDSAKVPKGVKAATSSRPGETTEVTFYQLASKIKKAKMQETAHMKLFLVDLPGYGFAYDSKSFIWKDTLQYYLLNRGKPLKRVLLLLDARHGMKKADIDFLTTWENSLYSSTGGAALKRKPNLPPLQLVLTKCDLVSQKDLARRVLQVEDQLSNCLRRQPSKLPVLMVSTRPEQCGIIELQKEIAAVIPEPDFRLPVDCKESLK